MAPEEDKDSGTTVEDEVAQDTSSDEAGSDDNDSEEKEPVKLTLEVKIDEPTTCERHITVTVAEVDIQRYSEDAISELMPTAQVPGFRAGRAPKDLVKSRFKKEVSEQVKGSLLMDSMAQVNEDHELAAISEPDIDLDAVSIPDKGPLTFEFDLEVRPDFDMPNWKGISIERPTRKFDKKAIDEELNKYLADEADLVPHEGAAELGDYITCNFECKHDGKVLAHGEEEEIRIFEELSFLDGTIEKFGKLMKKVKAGDKKETKLTLSDNAPNEELREKEVTVSFEVLDVKRLEIPELTEDLIEKLGKFENEGDLRDAISENLQRQLEYFQNQRARQQITELLVKDANWELPPDLLKRQAARELERSAMELQRSGFSDEQIQAHANQLQQNSMAATARSLKEHFILERIAEEESLEIDDDDFEQEISLIAMQSGESPRRIRARLEKGGMMDVLQNQIIERKVIDIVLENAKFKDIPFTPPELKTTALNFAAGGEKDKGQIPEAKAETEPEALTEPEDHT